MKDRRYVPGPYNRFIIYEPKERYIVSQSMIDKTINHLVAGDILIPTITKYLIDTNVASRINKGTKAGIEAYKNYKRICDISKFFYNILKQKLEKRIKDKEALKIVFTIIDSEEKRLRIGNMTS